MNELQLLAPAKLNLFLHITGRRPDGYHQLQTLFQLLDYGDQLHFRLNNAHQQIRLTPELPGVPAEQNLIVRAAHLLEPHKRLSAGVDIALTKRLPMGGGIGGGSSDAAATLVALNHLWQCQRSRAQLLELGLQLGADVPVFINAQTAWAEGVGERLQAIEMQPKWFLVAQPECHISTAEIFSHKDLTRDTPPIKVAAFLEQGGRNDCQALVRRLYPQVDEALNRLEVLSSTASLTGTGACVFARFDSAEDARKAQGKLPRHLPSFIAQGINQSPLYKWLPAN